MGQATGRAVDEDERGAGRPGPFLLTGAAGGDGRSPRRNTARRRRCAQNNPLDDGIQAQAGGDGVLACLQASISLGDAGYLVVIWA